jgi:hypothetical protein
VGGTTQRMRAHTADDTERAYYWPKLVALNKDFDDYQARTARKIPVVILTPR